MVARVSALRVDVLNLLKVMSLYIPVKSKNPGFGKAVKFENSAEGFNYFLHWASELAAKQKKDSVVVGLEPTGHYWFTMAAYLQGGEFKLVLVNSYHVKRSNELDDGHPSKSDKKDPKTIAKLVLEGRYIYPYIPQGLYAELRVAMNCRWRVRKELAATAANCLQQGVKALRVVWDGEYVCQDFAFRAEDKAVVLAVG